MISAARSENCQRVPSSFHATTVTIAKPAANHMPVPPATNSAKAAAATVA